MAYRTPSAPAVQDSRPRLRTWTHTSTAHRRSESNKFNFLAMALHDLWYKLDDGAYRSMTVGGGTGRPGPRHTVTGHPRPRLTVSPLSSRCFLTLAPGLPRGSSDLRTGGVQRTRGKKR